VQTPRRQSAFGVCVQTCGEEKPSPLLLTVVTGIIDDEIRIVFSTRFIRADVIILEALFVFIDAFFLLVVRKQNQKPNKKQLREAHSIIETYPFECYIENIIKTRTF
jgi:hypothetical protein